MGCCGKRKDISIRPARRSGKIGGGSQYICPICGRILRRVHNFDRVTKKQRVILRCSNPACQYRRKL